MKQVGVPSQSYTAVANTTNYVASITFVKVSWWRRMLRRWP